jgi:hypothetical protein
MKFFLVCRRKSAARSWLSAVLAATILFALAATCAAQTTPPAPTPQDQPHQGKLILSRTTDENGETTTQSALPATQQPTQPATQSTEAPPAAEAELTPAQTAERRAITFTGLDLDLHLRPAAQQMDVRAQLALRNDGKTSLTRIPLDLSSSLNWESVRVLSSEGAGKDATFQPVTIRSDADRTGLFHEALISLAAPLAPGQSLRLDVTYSGVIAASAQRLTASGAPEDAALHSEWDQISLPFTGLRGFGNVVWYPVVSLPVFLGEGARLFDEIGEQKLRLVGARFRLRLSEEFPHGQTPTVALVNGQSVELKITQPNGLDQGQEVDGVATADSGESTLGFVAPSLFVAIRTLHAGENVNAWTLPGENVSVDAWLDTATAVKPFLEGWLGRQPRSKLTLLDLPDADDAPFESGALLAAPLVEPDSERDPYALDGALVHSLARAWIAPPASSGATPPPAWLDEGLATFLGTLLVEKQQGRDAALRVLEAGRSALALAEPASPGQGIGQPLAQAIAPVYYRSKAAYVLWMLRDLAGDPAMAAAFASYNPAVRGSFEKQLEASEAHPDLGWFFADWIDADKGLPDLSIASVTPAPVSAGNWLTGVELANDGYAAAEIPVTVRSGSGESETSVTQRVRVPARGKVNERILIQGKPVEVQANNGTVPETQASIHITTLDQPSTTSSSAP